MSGGGARVSIPASVRRTIQNIKEIAGHHSDEDVYAMLKECAMDPNETAQKLLLQDTYHEVKRKRDRRKESLKEHADLRWRQGAQGRGGRGGRGNYPLRHLSNGGVEGKNIVSRKENGVYQGLDKGNKSPTNVATSIDNKSTTSITSKSETLSSTQRPLSQISDGRITSREEISADETGIHLAAADPVPVPSLDAHSSGEVADIKDTIQSQGAPVEIAVNKVASSEISGSELSSLNAEASAETSSSDVCGEIQVKSQGSVANQLPGPSQVASLSSFRGQTGSRPSSNYSNRSQQLVGSQKAVPNREWKPKSTSVNPVQASDLTDGMDAPILVGAVSQTPPVPASCSVDQEETTSDLEKKLDGLQLSARQHVIIPNHLQVPDSERHGLSFGSFDAGFNFKMGLANGHMSDTSTTLSSGLSHDTEEIVEHPTSSLDSAPVAAPEDYPDQPKSSAQIPENYSSREGAIPGVPSMEGHELAKEESVASQEDAKYQTIQPSNSTQVLGSQFSSIGNSEPQTHNTTQVQQPLDPSASYYTQFYRSTADADGHLSPFLATGGSTKYNGNVATVPTQTNQSQQESGNFSNAASTSLTTQAAGSVQSSITVPQPVPVYRQPSAVHLPHYPIQYSQYFPMFYVPPTIHPFLSSAAFPQQPPIGSMYPSPGAAAAAPPVKFSLPQYKPGTDIGNSALIGTAAAYGTYTSMPAGYTPNPILGSGNSTGNEDPNSTQFRENNLYSSEQQSESSGIWIPAHGRDISGLQASSFYSVPPQGQHMTFAPTQTVHNSAFSGIYHPAPAVAASAVHPIIQQSQGAAGAAEIAATPPPAGAYQQPQQHAQINWTNNY